MTHAFGINDLVTEGPLSRSKLYEDIRAGRLPAKKAGGRTIVLAEDWQRYLTELPDYPTQNAA